MMVARKATFHYALAKVARKKLIGQAARSLCLSRVRGGSDSRSRGVRLSLLDMPIDTNSIPGVLRDARKIA